MKPFWSIGTLLLLCVGVFWGACGNTVPTGVAGVIDSLNRTAYESRYRDLEKTRREASSAYEQAGRYALGKAQAGNLLGFCAFMEMNLVAAEQYYKEVYELTSDELERLVADIGLMKICQRKGLNKEFYDYRNRALRRINRIAEDDGLFIDGSERARLSYARSEFYLVSATYYYYLQQQEDAQVCIQQALEVENLEKDTSQLLYARYLRGAAGLCEGKTALESKLREFDELYAAWRIASLKGFRYFEGNSLQGLANLMTTSEELAFWEHYRGHALMQLEIPVDSLFSLRLAQKALCIFRTYQDPYQIAGASVTIGKYLNRHGKYEEALDTLTQAMEEVNHFKGTAPECMSRISEQLSVSYAGLDSKWESDFHRNLYLDILEDTRQDKELESRYQALEEESAQLSGMLIGVLAGLVGVLLFFWFFNKRSRLRSRMHEERLKLMLEMCQKITSSIPAEAQTEEEVMEAIRNAVLPLASQLFGTDDIRIEQGKMWVHKHLNKEETAMIQVFNPYVQWALDNGTASITLGDKRKELEKKRYIFEQHIAANKRQNVVKKACLAIVNGMQPYIDRLLNEVSKVRGTENEASQNVKFERFQYMKELVDTINESNEILARWIQMKQGTLNLNIESFDLDELFDLLRKGSRSFELKKQTLEVVPAGVQVKADRALTMFMLNTLADNARKFTPRGGKVRVSAEQTDTYVEIAVEDTGCGLSEKDRLLLEGEKVYDSRKIGEEVSSHPKEWKQNKGSGFGLMNCKGIIEKYKKTNALFQVCTFGVQSELGKGSRFYFRLPLGVRKGCMILIGVLAGCFPMEAQVTEVHESVNRESYEVLLDSASDYADAAYYSNVDGDYIQALHYIDSARMCLNRHYLQYAVHPQDTMVLAGKGVSAELQWWNEPFNSDFHVILDIRNEAAVAYLALKQWDAYSYNNAAYTTLYKLLGEDQSLESYCRQLEQSTRHQTVGMLLAIGLLVAVLLGYYILYIRKRLMYRWNLEQVLEINRQLFAAAQPVVAGMDSGMMVEESNLQDIPRKMVQAVYEEMDDLLGIEGLGIGVGNETAHKLEVAFHALKEDDHLFSGRLQRMQRCWEEERALEEAGSQAWPLHVEIVGQKKCIGVLYLERKEGGVQKADRLLLELIARYVAVVAFNAVVKLATKYRDIEIAEDEARRASWEDNILHVQNQVLDNCLSTIKHETVYYPNKTRQLIVKLGSHALSEKEEHETVEAIGELMAYYKAIFTLLSHCAARQLEEVTFRRSVVEVADLLESAERYHKKKAKHQQVVLTLELQDSKEQVLGDVNLLQYLIESLLDEAWSIQESGKLLLSVQAEEDFVRFQLTDRRRNRSQEELNRLFYPSLERMNVSSRGQLTGTEFLIAKQIIRDHDEYIGRRGCRINAEVCQEGGFTVYFTVPRWKK